MKPRFGMSFYNQLKQELGEIDASAACLELAMREFIAASELSSSPTTFIQQLSAKLGIRVDAFDMALFVRRSSALRIIGVAQAFEAFLDRFIEGHPRIVSKDGRKDDETLLTFVVRKLALPKDVRIAVINSLDYKLYDYYRQIRNGVVHQVRQIQPATQLASLHELQGPSAADPRYARLVAPNSAQGLTFDDYVLFSRAAKSIAAQLSQISGPSGAEIIDWIERHRDKSGSLARQANNVRTLLRVAFGLNPESADEFVIHLKLMGQ
jgi:hypothetical protein